MQFLSFGPFIFNLHSICSCVHSFVSTMMMLVCSNCRLLFSSLQEPSPFDVPFAMPSPASLSPAAFLPLLHTITTMLLLPSLLQLHPPTITPLLVLPHLPMAARGLSSVASRTATPATSSRAVSTMPSACATFSSIASSSLNLQSSCSLEWAVCVGGPSA